MITEFMTLNSVSDARVWSAQMGLSAAQEERVAEWIWDAKPEYGCTWAEFQAANEEILESKLFWDIAGDE